MFWLTVDDIPAAAVNLSLSAAGRYKVPAKDVG